MDLRSKSLPYTILTWAAPTREGPDRRDAPVSIPAATPCTPSPPVDTHTRGVVLSHFETMKLLGEGSTSKVSLVRHRCNGLLYAMKTVDRDRGLQRHGDQFRNAHNEVDLLREVDHPNIVRVFAHFVEEGKYHVVMEYVQGCEMFSLIGGSQPSTTGHWCFILAQITLALEHMHARGIVYRDLKPENVLIDSHGHVKLVDFGSAKRIGERGGLAGTAEYLAPEVIRGHPHGPEADWWALGICLYEMFVGYTPFRNRSCQASDPEFAMYRKILTGQFDLNFEALGSSVRHLIEALLQVNPRQRAGAKEIRTHPFMASIDWAKLESHQPGSMFPILEEAAAEEPTDRPRSSKQNRRSTAPGRISVLPTRTPLSSSDFTVLRQLGEGSASRVFLVEYRETKEIYALKVIPQPMEAGSQRLAARCHVNEMADPSNPGTRVRSEIATLEQLENPFIVRLMGHFAEENNIYVVMEYVRGAELFSVVREAGRLPVAMARFVAAQLALVLSYLHARGFVFRDLKTENVIVEEDGYCKLVDFGSARHIGDHMNIIATPQYVAPEVIRGDGFTLASDWWTFGILVWELLLGRTPFEAPDNTLEDEYSLYRRILKGHVDFDLPEIDAEARDMLAGLLQVNPSKRLGAGVEGGRDVRLHPWFADVDWEQLEARQIPSPLVELVKRIRVRGPSVC